MAGVTTGTMLNYGVEHGYTLIRINFISETHASFSGGKPVIFMAWLPTNKFKLTSLVDVIIL